MTPSTSVSISISTELLPMMLVLGLATLTLALYAMRWALAGRSRSARIDCEQATPLLGRFPMEAFHWTMRAAGSALVRLRFTPDALTYLSLVLTAATVPLIALGAFAWGAFALLTGSIFDALDGIVARERGVASDSGEVLDAVVDRYADALPFAGLVLFYRQSVLAIGVVLLAWMGSYAVSYVRAKAEAMSVSVRGGMMRRHERLLYVGIALLLGIIAPPMGGFVVARPLTLLVVGGIAVLSNIAAVQLMVRTRRQLNQAGRGPEGNRRA